MTSEHLRYRVDASLDQAGQAAGGEHVPVGPLLRELVEPSVECPFGSREPVALRGLDGERVLHAVG